MKTNSRGFTLIELLVVIAIIAILSVVVILTLNPAELLRQARDSNRISDLSTLKTAIGQYLADVSSPTLGFTAAGTTYTVCRESNTTSTAVAHANCGFTLNIYTVSSSDSRAVDGSGWIPVDFTDISSGAPIGTLPVDPTNANEMVYRYAASSTLVYELNAIMESTKQTNSTTGAAATDGGTDASSTIYAAGTAPGLAL